MESHWKAIEARRPTLTIGPPYYSITLTKGDKRVEMLYLQHDFARIPKGKCDLDLSWRVTAPGQDGEEIAYLTTKMKLDIKAATIENLVALRKRMEALLDKSDHSIEEEGWIDNQLVHLKHDGLAPVAMRLLASHHKDVSTVGVTDYLEKWADRATKNRRELIDFIQDKGTHEFARFLDHWHAKKVCLTDEEATALFDSKDTRIRTTAYRYWADKCPKEKQESLRKELQEICYQINEVPFPLPRRMSW
jgi:hypothetical protein